MLDWLRRAWKIVVNLCFSGGISVVVGAWLSFSSSWVFGAVFFMTTNMHKIVTSLELQECERRGGGVPWIDPPRNPRRVFLSAGSVKPSDVHTHASAKGLRYSSSRFSFLTYSFPAPVCVSPRHDREKERTAPPAAVDFPVVLKSLHQICRGSLVRSPACKEIRSCGDICPRPIQRPEIDVSYLRD